MKTQNKILIVLLAGSLCALRVHADARRFNYSYEPEVEAAGDWEFEQSVSLGAARNSTVGQKNYNLWKIREELEHGFTDRYTAALYINLEAESFRDPATGNNNASSRFEGVSLENRYQVLNPKTHAVGLTLYLEPRISRDEAELEQKIILGQRCGDWKWAFNLTHSSERVEGFRKTEGEFETSLGLARDLNSRWSAGIELRDFNALPDYSRWEYTAVFAGPVVSYRRSGWWAALTVMPQIYGKNFNGNPDGNPHLVLDDQERLNVRLMFGFEF